MAIRTTTRVALFACASILPLMAAPAFAQDAAGVAAEDDGVITVTARRREESLLNVPIAISAFTGAQLEQGGAIDVTDIANSTPNVTLEVSRGTNSHAQRVHPRRRPAGSGRGLRKRCRPLSRRCVPQPPAGRGARYI